MKYKQDKLHSGNKSTTISNNGETVCCISCLHTQLSCKLCCFAILLFISSFACNLCWRMISIFSVRGSVGLDQVVGFCSKLVYLCCTMLWQCHSESPWMLKRKMPLSFSLIVFIFVCWWRVVSPISRQAGINACECMCARMCVFCISNIGCFIYYDLT